jgi:hypothetical protein
VGDQQEPRDAVRVVAGPGVGGRRPVDLGHPPGQGFGQGRAGQRRAGQRLDADVVGRDEPADGLGQGVGPVGRHQAAGRVEGPDHVVDQGVGVGVVDVQQRGPTPGGGLGQLAAALVGHLDDQPVDDGRVAAGVHVEVDDVGPAGGEVGGDGGQVPGLVRQLHPELVSGHATRVRRPDCRCLNTARPLCEQDLTPI